MSQQIKIYDTNKIDEKLNGKTNSIHSHPISQVTNLQKTLDSKASISAVGAADAKATACQKDINSIKTTLNDKLGKNETAKESVSLISSNGRIGSLNIDLPDKGKVFAQLDCASSSVTEGKPAGDGYVWTHIWDNGGKWTTQLFLPDGGESNNNSHVQVRRCNGGTWGNWRDIAWKDEVDTKADIGHTHHWNDIYGEPGEFTPSPHKHQIADINFLQSELDRIPSLQQIITWNTFINQYPTDLKNLTNKVNLKQDKLTSGSTIKTINNKSLLGSGNIDISTNVPTASQSTAGIYKVMTYSPVNTSNWYADDIVLSGKALKYISEQLKWGSSSSSSYPTKTGYLGAYATADADKHKQIKLADLTGGTKGRFYYIWGTEKCEYGILSVQQKTTFYRDYDCLAMSSNDHGYWSASELFVSIYIPPNTTYYLWGTNIKNVYARWFE